MTLMTYFNGHFNDLKVLTFTFCFNSTENMPIDSCAVRVYATCGGRFKHKLQKYPGFYPAQLCKVFIEEGNCIKETAAKPPPLYCAGSGILKRFKENSNEIAPSVLGALCLLPA